MKVFRVALSSAGALTALVGGACTANWGLSPLHGSVDSIAQNGLASGPAPVGAKSIATAQYASTPGYAPDVTGIAYAVPPAPPMNNDREAPRIQSESIARSPLPGAAMDDSESAADIMSDNMPSQSPEAETSAPRDEAHDAHAAIDDGSTGNTVPD